MRIFVFALNAAALASAWQHSPSQAVAEHAPALIALIPAVDDDPKSRALETAWDAVEGDSLVAKFSIACAPEVEVCRAVNSKDLPAVVYVDAGGRQSRYHGPRSAARIDGFARRMQRPVVSLVAPGEEPEFQAIDDVVCTARIDRQRDAQLLSTYEEVARRYRTEFTFGLVALGDDAGGGGGDAESAATIRCHRRADQKTPASDLKGMDVESVEKWLLEATRETITPLTPHNHQRLLDRQWPMIYIIAPLPSHAHLLTQLRPFASSHPDLTTVLVDPLDFPDLPAQLGLEPGRYPAGAVHQLTTGRIWPYPYDRDLSSAQLQRWGLDVWQGKVRAWNAKEEPEEARAAAGKGARVHRHIKVANIPGLKVRMTGRDEL